MQARQMVLPRFSKYMRSPVLIPMMKKAVKRMMSHKNLFGMNNLPRERNPDESPSRSKEGALRHWHPMPSGFGPVTLARSSSNPDAGQSDSVSQIHQICHFTTVNPDNE